MSRDEIILEEIKIIQPIISRMANNSFLIKGWTVTGVMLSLLLNGNNAFHVRVACIIPILCFWFLDAYYLQQEKRFRGLHEWIITHRRDTDEHLFSLDNSNIKVEPLRNIMATSPLFAFYFILIVMYILIISYSFAKLKGWI